MLLIKSERIRLVNKNWIGFKFSVRLAYPFILVFLFGFSRNNSFCQKLVQDSLIVHFPRSVELKPIHGVIDSVVDQRDSEPHVIGEYEVTKYLFVPVDLLICTEKPLADEVNAIFNGTVNTKQSLRLKLVLDDFWLTKKTGSWLYPHYQLNASVQLYEKNQNNNSVYVGHLVYETVSRQSLFGDKLKRGFEKVMEKWRDEFVDDLTIVSKNLRSYQDITLDNFRTGIFSGRRTHLYGGMDVVMGTRDWLVDGALFFSHREAGKPFFRSGGYNVRYRNAKTFESIEFGLSIDYLFHRLNRQMILRGKSQIMLGFNRWKDIDTKDHKIYDVLILNYSLSQSLIFDPLDERGIFFGVGLLEDVYYVYSKGIEFQLGLLFHLGLKL